MIDLINNIIICSDPPVYLSTFISTCLSVCLITYCRLHTLTVQQSTYFFCLFIYLFTCSSVHIIICLPVCLFTNLPVNPAVSSQCYRSLCLSTNLPIYLLIHIFICQSFLMFTSIPTNLSISLHIYLPVDCLLFSFTAHLPIHLFTCLPVISILIFTKKA